ncbi:MAG: ATPase, partial [Archaeoglobaceae archaeon]
IPSALQTLLHELFEEKQITTPEGDIVPLKIDCIVIASTNPANYKGVSDIKEPLLDRMEQIEIGPPETIEEEIEIAMRNMSLKIGPLIPEWHLRILAGAVRCMRSKECRYASRIEFEPSCRATIKLFDHLRASAMLNKRKVVMFADYGKSYENVKLALKSRFEVDYEEEVDKDSIIEGVVEDSIDKIGSEIYSSIPRNTFTEIMDELAKAEIVNVYEDDDFGSSLYSFASSMCKHPEEVASAVEMTLEAIARCTGLLEKIGVGVYVCAGIKG